MIGRFGAQLGLLAFVATLAAGIVVGNPPATVLSRALLCLVMALVLGQLVGWASKLVLRDHLQRVKVGIDQHHVSEADALDAIGDAAAEPSET